MPIGTFTAQVDSIKDLTHDVRQLDLRLIEPKTIVFKPGQFISFEMPHPKTGHLVTRAYSIASQPSRSDRGSGTICAPRPTGRTDKWCLTPYAPRAQLRIKPVHLPAGVVEMLPA